MNRSQLQKVLVGKFSFRRMIVSFIIIYLIVCCYAWFVSNGMLFLPQKPTYKVSGALTFLSIGDERIAALYSPVQGAEFTILFSHGNAEDLGNVQADIRTFNAWGFSVLAYDYRGYGQSDGAPSEANAVADAQCVYDHAVETLDIEPERVILWGRSVGSGPTCKLLSKNKCAAVVIESGFKSAFTVLTKIPIFPVDRFRNLPAVRRSSVPVLITRLSHFLSQNLESVLKFSFAINS